MTGPAAAQQQETLQQERPSTPPVRQECGCCNPECEGPSLETRAFHKSRKTLSWAHSICCVEARVNREWVIVDDSDKVPTEFLGKRFPVSLLPEDSQTAGACNKNGNNDWALSGFSGICLGSSRLELSVAVLWPKAHVIVHWTVKLVRLSSSLLCLMRSILKPTLKLSHS